MPFPLRFFNCEHVEGVADEKKVENWSGQGRVASVIAFCGVTEFITSYYNSSEECLRIAAVKEKKK